MEKEKIEIEDEEITEEQITEFMKNNIEIMEEVQRQIEEEDADENEIDTIMLKAQDSFFEGDLTSVISYCEKALSLNPKEKEAYDLITIAHFENTPPNFEACFKIAQDWGKFCGESEKQLIMLLKSNYFQKNSSPKLIAETSTKISRRKEVVFSSLFAATICCDCGENQVAEEISKNVAINDEELDPFHILASLLWIDLHNEKKEQKATEALLSLFDNKDVDISAISLAIVFLCLFFAEKKKDLQTAENHFSKIQKIFLEQDDSNIQALEIYFKLKKNLISAEEATKKLNHTK